MLTRIAERKFAEIKEEDSSIRVSDAAVNAKIIAALETAINQKGNNGLIVFDKIAALSNGTKTSQRFKNVYHGRTSADATDIRLIEQALDLPAGWIDKASFDVASAKQTASPTSDVKQDTFGKNHKDGGIRIKGTPGTDGLFHVSIAGEVALDPSRSTTITL